MILTIAGGDGGIGKTTGEARGGEFDLEYERRSPIMKIAVTAQGPTLDDPVDPRFGRSSLFLVVDTETLTATPVENPNSAAGGGAGIQSAQLMADHDVHAVLTGNCGPNAYRTLEAADIRVVTGVSGTIREAVEKFSNGSLSNAAGPNVTSHFGTNSPNAT